MAVLDVSKGCGSICLLEHVREPFPEATTCMRQLDAEPLALLWPVPPVLCEVILMLSGFSSGSQPLAAIDPVLDKSDVAQLLQVPITWVASHPDLIPGMFRLGRYLRFRRVPFEEWLGSFTQVLKPDETAALLRVPTSWVYSHADEIPGILRLGYYVRFRRSVIEAFLGGSETCQ